MKSTCFLLTIEVIIDSFFQEKGLVFQQLGCALTVLTSRNGETFLVSSAYWVAACLVAALHSLNVSASCAL